MHEGLLSIVQGSWTRTAPAAFRRVVLQFLLATRPGRWFLAAATTLYVRRRTGTKIRVFHDTVWGHVVDGVRIPDSRKFCYYGAVIDGWVGEPAKWLRTGRQFWCETYCPEPGDTVIDIGAGMGSDTYFFSSVVGAEGNVLAIEANPNTFTLLTRLCAWNKLSNVTCRQLAIVDHPKCVMIEDGDTHEANALVASAATAGSVPVQGIPLDDLVAAEGIDRIDFIKMNIEGAELLAVKGMRNALKRTRHVCIACHDFRAERGEGEQFRTRPLVEATLRDIGFQLLPVDTRKSPAIRDHVHGFRDVQASRRARCLNMIPAQTTLVHGRIDDLDATVEWCVARRNG